MNIFAERRLAFVIASAACLHLAVATALHLVGKLELFPHVVDRDGIVVSVAPDGIDRLAEARALAGGLTEGGISTWAAAQSPMHVKLYALSLAAFGPLFGFNVLGLEPLNLSYFLTILFLVHRLCREAFGGPAASIATGVVALWPSLLLHTAQLLRDSLFIPAMLVLVLVNVTWLTRAHTWRKGAVAGIAAGAVAALLWVVRYDMWPVAVAVPLLGFLLLAVRQLRERRLLAGNMIGIILLLILTAGIPRFVPLFQKPDVSLPPPAQDAAKEQGGPNADAGGVKTPPPPSTAGPRGMTDRILVRVSEQRHRFIMMYPDAGSNIDTEERFDDFADVVRYLPRAAAIGLFAPFPSMWFAGGASAGRAARLLAGLETMFMYVIECFALIGLWKRRGNLAAWLLLLVATTGVTALGLVVTNVGTLYRLRYVFWVMLVIMGAEGTRHFLSLLSAKRRSRSAGTTALTV